jgi:hypothetical protein
MEVDIHGAVWTDRQPAVVFKAKRKIMPGEELTISYYPEGMRVSALFRVYLNNAIDSFP